MSDDDKISIFIDHCETLDVGGDWTPLPQSIDGEFVGRALRCDVLEGSLFRTDVLAMEYSYADSKYVARLPLAPMTKADGLTMYDGSGLTFGYNKLTTSPCRVRVIATDHRLKIRLLVHGGGVVFAKMPETGEKK